MPWFAWPLLTAWAAYTSFVLLYATRSHWRATDVGRSLMLSKAAIVLLLTNALVGILAGPYPGRHVVWGVLFSALTAGGVAQLWMLLRYQRQDRG